MVGWQWLTHKWEDLWKSKRAATYPVSSLADLFPDDGKKPVTEDTAMTVATVYRAMSIISETMAGLPIRIVKKQGARVEIIEQHKLIRTLDLEFNRNEGAFLGKSRIQASALLGRAGYAEILRSPLDPSEVQLQVIDHKRVQPQWVKGPDGRWQRVFQIDQGKAYIPDRNIIQIPGFAFDGLDGMSVIEQAANAISHSLSLEAYGSGSFGKGAAPTGIIKTNRVLTLEQKQRMKASWEAVNNGPNSVAVLDEDYVFTPVTINNQDKQFLESRRFQVIEIARWFGLPPHMLAELGDANYATTEALGAEFKMLTLQSWVNKWEQELTRKLLTQDEVEQGYRVSFDMDGLLRPDFKTRMEGYRTAISIGLMTINECRLDNELPPSDDPRCDEHLIQLNLDGGSGAKDTTGNAAVQPGSGNTQQGQ